MYPLSLSFSLLSPTLSPPQLSFSLSVISLSVISLSVHVHMCARMCTYVCMCLSSKFLTHVQDFTCSILTRMCTCILVIVYNQVLGQAVCGAPRPITLLLQRSEACKDSKFHPIILLLLLLSLLLLLLLLLPLLLHFQPPFGTGSPLTHTKSSYLLQLLPCPHVIYLCL